LLEGGPPWCRGACVWFKQAQDSPLGVYLWKRRVFLSSPSSTALLTVTRTTFHPVRACAPTPEPTTAEGGARGPQEKGEERVFWRGCCFMQRKHNNGVSPPHFLEAKTGLLCGGAKNAGWGKLVSASVSATFVRILSRAMGLGEGREGGGIPPHFFSPFFSAHNTGQRGPDGAAQTSFFFGRRQHLPFRRSVPAFFSRIF